MENIYKQYFDSLPCFLTVQDRNFKVIDANEKFCENFGDYRGRYCYQIYKNRPEKCEVCPVEKSFRDGQAHSSQEVVKTLEGREVDVIVNTKPIRNGGGEIVAVMEMSTDITEIKLLQKQLRESQDRCRFLFEEVPCYISIQDRDLRIVDANRRHRESFGTSYGKKCYEAYKHRTEECLPCIVRQTFEDGETRTHEEVVTSQDNRRMNVLVHTAPIRNALDEIEQVIEMSTDITQIRCLQDKLSSIGLLISSISHDLKGLLNGLDGGIYLVNSGMAKNKQDRVERGWEIVQRNLNRIRTLVMDILYYAKDREPNRELTSPGKLLKDVCELVESRARQLEIEFKYDIDPNAGEFKADRQAIRSLLVNLIENSLDACRIDKQKSTHKVTVKLEGKPESISFKITDNGIGMDRETREKAFSLFFSSKGASGTGLGLFIANKITQAHGGSIEVESESGKGTAFFVEIPRKCAKEESAENTP